MKSIQLFIVSLAIVACFSCKSEPQKLGDFKLLPSTQQFDITGVSDINPLEFESYYIPQDLELPPVDGLFDELRASEKASGAHLILKLDQKLDIKPEAYTLNISQDQINISAKDEAGLFYGCISLAQLLEDAQEQEVNLPLCKIVDYPLLSYRAIQLDVKHHREKKDYYYRIIDKLAKYKVNAIIVELEDKIKYERQPLIGSDDALTIAEWKDLSDYAQNRNIEISPLVQGLGHASFILKHDEFKELRDDPTSDWAFNPLDPRTYEVQYDLYRDAMAATPHGKYLHVGGDEVHTTGRGSGKSALELQLNWLNKVCKFAEEHDRIPIFWDDMPLKHAGVYNAMFQPELSKSEVEALWEENEHKLSEFLDLFPKNCIYMRWNYASPQAIGNTKAMDWFQKHGMQVMGATAGQRRWVLMPQDGGNLENIKTFARSSIEQNLNGLLLTLWDDDSPHFELYWRGIIAFAEYTWAGAKDGNEALLAAYRHREFSNVLGDKEFGFVDDLETPVVFFKDALLDGINRNNIKKNPEAITKGVINFPDRNYPGKWVSKYSSRLEEAEHILKISDSVASKIRAMKSQATRNQYTLEVYEQVNQLTRFAPKALLALKRYDLAQSEEQVLDALQEINSLKTEFGSVRSELEKVYGQTRILEKPENYILDQDHHVHLANQSTNFDWQFYAELLFLEKLEKELLSKTIN